MIRKAKINNAVYREDYNVLVLDVHFLDNEENKKLVLRAGVTTKKKADANCASMIGKEIKMDMSAEFGDMMSVPTTDKVPDVPLRQYPFAESVALLKEESPEHFPQEDEEDGNHIAWYTFPDKEQFKDSKKKKKVTKRRKAKQVRRKTK